MLFRSTTLVYTGIAKGEIGALNYVDKEVYLVNLQNGYTTHVLKLDTEIPTQDRFNFTYANKLFWFFDKDKREWSGYKMRLNK